jgi:hypothetical protein
MVGYSGDGRKAAHWNRGEAIDANAPDTDWRCRNGCCANRVDWRARAGFFSDCADVLRQLRLLVVRARGRRPASRTCANRGARERRVRDDRPILFDNERNSYEKFDGSHLPRQARRNRPDGQLITGQNPASSALAAKSLLDLLTHKAAGSATTQFASFTDLRERTNAVDRAQ